MSFKKKVKHAKHILDKLDDKDYKSLIRICKEIQKAEKSLFQATRRKMNRCQFGCDGLCCRNIQIDAIISLWDLIYIMAIQPELRHKIIRRARQVNIPIKN